jgi:four helix bundle protein
MNAEDIKVYKKLCRLHIDACDLTHKWPQEEIYELGSQSRRFSNSVPAQLAEKNESLPHRWPQYHFSKLRGRPITTDHAS